MTDTDDLRRTYLAMLLPDRLRDDAEEWDLGQCPMRAETSRQAADRIEQLERERDELLADNLRMGIERDGARARADKLRLVALGLAAFVAAEDESKWDQFNERGEATDE